MKNVMTGTKLTIISARTAALSRGAETECFMAEKNAMTGTLSKETTVWSAKMPFVETEN